ncbi:TIGR04282 family arsenosugar biosynthesis glycosyltransferase [Qipengyuania soli]|uniref:TIGR04282 family arsenosugar biosynthesis glycosyltransferase n=1 Tax=Qipengyuania soli TaxID=2782568 RepID=A0A7S8F362_9SPHN|nr:TIGR04282 family arsenosugar biosynthesis glycosyltransferase [Qipengyuania soli]QPC98288.1 TIGR04282 family arsenosugar biosynthesis glycosyltransferase [Qipengyuania soli]
MEAVRLVIFARLPQPGMVKTRLIPALGETGAAELYRRLLDHTLAEARASGLPVELRVTGGEIADFRQIFGDDFDLVEQGEGDLGERLDRVPTPAIIIGSDCPGISAPVLRAAADALVERSVVLGPATDGGYYLIGHREPVSFLFENMAWSTPSVFAETLVRLAARGIGPAILPELADIDTPEDLASWPELQ